MSKILKPLAFVAAAALAIPTLGASTAIAGALGVSSAVGGLLATGSSLALMSYANSRGSASGSALSDLERLNLTQVAGAARKMVVGHTAMATDLRYTEPSGAQDRYVDAIIHLASHRCEAVESIYISNQLAWTAAGGAQGVFAGYLTAQVILESSASAYHVVNSGSKWGAAQRMTGCCTLKLRIDRKAQSSSSASPFAAGLPSQIVIVGKGMPVYDPRRDSTVPGGSGPHRANDCTTWQYTAGGVAIGENIALQALSYCLGWRIGSWVSVGLGVPASRLDMQAFAASANACEEPITLAAGGTQPRFFGGGLLTDDLDPTNAMAQFAAACCGRWDDSTGRLGLHVAVNDLSGALVQITDADFLGGVEWRPCQDIRYNIVRGQNPDPSGTALYQPTDYPEAKLASLDGIDRAMQLDLALIGDKATPQRIAKQTLQRQQFQGILAGVIGVRGWNLRYGQPVRVSSRLYGWTDKLFRVSKISFNLDASVNVELREESPLIYQWDHDERAPVVPAPPVQYDPRNQGGGDGADGAPGPPGADGYTSSPSPVFTLSATAGGVVKAGQLPATAQLQIYRYGANVTASGTFSVVSQSGLGVSVSATGLVTVSSILGDKGSAIVQAVIGGNTITWQVEASKASDGAAGTSVQVSVPQTWTSTYGARGTTADLALGAGRTAEATFFYDFTVTSATCAADAYLEYSTDGGSSWSSIGSVSTGTATGAGDVGSIALDVTLAAAGADRVVRFRLQGRMDHPERIDTVSNNPILYVFAN